MIVNDIEKMKAEFAAKLELAEKENAINEGIEGYILALSSYVGKVKEDGVKYSIVARIPYKSGVGFENPTIPQAKEVLDRFPMTQDILYDKKFSLPYVIHSSRSFGSRYGELSISWISGVYDMRITLRIDPFVEEFFTSRLRHTTSCENSTYTQIHTNRLYERPCVPEYNFKKEHNKYYGGVRLLTDRDEILRIIDFIKNYKA